MEHPPRLIAVCGAFDMRNFGDLMFPVLARARLERLGFEIAAVAPSASDPGMGLGAPRAASDLFAPDWALDGVLIGGGYIIHTQPISAHVALTGPGAAQAGVTELVDCWAGGTLAAAVRDIPVAWNAPGVPFPFASGQRRQVAAIAAAADYLSVRDTTSAQLLDPEGSLGAANVPDPVAELARFWTRDSLRPDEAAFRARAGISAETPILAVHIRDRSLNGYGAERLGRQLSEFAAAQGLMPVLLALGQAHDDGATAAEVARFLTVPHAILADPPSLREVAAVTAAAQLYVGASLHGYITAAAYGVPAALVARPAYGKFMGFLDHAGWQQDLSRDWDAAFARARTLISGPTARPLPDSVGAALDRHWTRIAEVLSAGPAPGRARRQTLLRDHLALGVQRRGLSWATAPLLLNTKER